MTLLAALGGALAVVPLLPLVPVLLVLVAVTTAGRGNLYPVVLILSLFLRMARTASRLRGGIVIFAVGVLLCRQKINKFSYSTWVGVEGQEN